MAATKCSKCGAWIYIMKDTHQANHEARETADRLRDALEKYPHSPDQGNRTRQVIDWLDVTADMETVGRSAVGR